VTHFAQRACRQLDRFGNFRLTDAVRPGPGLPIVPTEGYRVERYRDPATRTRIPVLTASVSQERLFETFLSLLEPLGQEVDVILETSHEIEPHVDLHRRHIDRPVLESYLCEYEELLTNDGCTGVAVMATHGPMEVQFDEHKLLIIYAQDLKPFRRILSHAGIPRRRNLPVIFDAPHMHLTKPGAIEQFDRLARVLGVGAEADMVAG
jgi:hypothetical protein